MNEELENVLNSDTPKNQGENNVEIESESSLVGDIFTFLACLNILIGMMLMIVESSNYSSDTDYSIASSDTDYSIALSVLGSSLFLFAVASCLKFLAKISSRMGRIMKALEK